MSKLGIPREAQIAGLLAGFLIGADGWRDRYLGAGVRTRDVRFGDAFSVTEKDVVDHVLQKGWDRRYVKPIDELPQSLPEDDVAVFAFVGRADDGSWRLLSPFDPERNSERFSERRFDDERAMVSAVVAALFERQRGRFA